MEPRSGEHRALAGDLRRLVGGRLLDPLDILLGDDEPSGAGGSERLRERLEARSREWADTLLGENDQAAAYLAIRLVSALYPGDAPFDPPAAWWDTPLGRAVARRAGHPAASAVPVSAAAAMLGITRQGVHDLLRRGKLERAPDGGVTTASIQARLSARSAADPRPIQGGYA
ncbi:hypothetical protein [Planomonospora venezuelensis]|uniref:Uncharacterized protein n=1 Tax=Planomonospora venezuelensis TaxID=1999 RepID=A0A841DBY6_PLAVE|nr:hypothetical protein [Planomonospora venezuelensis]MBB5966999.1 hypothetical protein [Planomonospora venezuelensis]GIN01532.1 hypothetical protein Pve01_31900 [Planomonospora venezuelensis]